MQSQQGASATNRILLFTDQPIADIGFRSVMEPTRFFVLPSCTAVDQLLPRIQRDGPDLIVIDLARSVTLRVLQEVNKATQARVVLWAESIAHEFAYQAYRVGIHGVIRKGLPIGVQIQFLERLAAGELLYEKYLTDAFLRAPRLKLTPREADLVALVASGMANKAISRTLGIAEGTIKVYLSRLYQKLGCEDRHGLAVWGLMNLGDSPESVLGNAPRTIMMPARTIPDPTRPHISTF